MPHRDQNPHRIGDKLLEALRFIDAHGPRDIEQTPVTRCIRGRLRNLKLIQLAGLGVGTGLRVEITPRGRHVLAQNATRILEPLSK